MILRLALLLLLALPAWAQGLPPGVTPADQTSIRDVIGKQLDAFKRDDAGGAYQFAAPNIKQIFPTPEGFLDMVRRAYPPVYHPRAAEFSELALRDGEIVQEVELVGPDGARVLALYTMTRDGAGGWVISGCSLIPSVRVTA